MAGRQTEQEGRSTGVTLDLVGGQQVQVVEVLGGPRTSRRLAQLGIRAGATVRVRRAAPLSGPLLIEIGGSLVALGRGLAARVVVHKLP
jgi:ferrous iron transport protein A